MSEWNTFDTFKYVIEQVICVLSGIGVIILNVQTIQVLQFVS